MDGPVKGTDRRFRTPERKPAIKRKELIHKEEPDTKKMIREYSDIEIDSHYDGGADVDAIHARKEDLLILSRAMLGKSLLEVYSNERIGLAVGRNAVESPNKLASTDVSEMFSPERLTKVCKQYGLTPGAAMDIKNGYNFDLAADRAKAWKSVVEDEPMFVIGSPPCTFVSRLQELNKYMYRNDKLWMSGFAKNIQQAKRRVRFCANIYEHQRQAGR